MKRLIWVVVLSLVLAPVATPARAADVTVVAGRPAADSIYVVQPGDSLWRIATRTGVSVAALVAANGFPNDKVILQIGQQLIIPGGVAGTTPTGGAPSTAPATTGSGGTYVVKAGDSLGRIAARTGTTVAGLVAANGFASAAVIIHPGQVLNLPGGAAVSSSAPPPATQLVATTGTPGVNHLGTEKVVLADYVMWYDQNVFDGSKTWDVPRDGAYNSGDYGVIQRQVGQAQQACLSGLAAHWYGPNESWTTSNFNLLLQASAGTGLRHALVMQANIWDGASEDSIAAAIKYALDNWAYGPNYLRLGGRPVFIFTDMPRPWGSDAAALAGWARIRAAVDPDHKSIWMAEGLTTTYNPLFDGLYAYRIDHRDYPQSWLKQPRWAAALHAAGSQLYFADTIAPGFDDTRSVNLGGDRRSGAPHFARDRANGQYFADTFAATSQTGGDFLFVKSFNEWVEGTEIEPGTTYGDAYLNLTCQYANAYRSR